jgi:hypothetical protein
MIKGTTILYRLYNNEPLTTRRIEFEPFSIQKPEHYGFIRSKLFLDMNAKTIVFEAANGKNRSFSDEILQVKVLSIIKTKIHKNIKKLIQLHVLKKQLIKENKDIKKYIKKEDIEYLKYKNFMFSIILDTDTQIDIILNEYDSFKKWLNGMAMLINNKYSIFYK